MKKDLTVSFLRANVVAFLVFIPTGLLALLYFEVWGWRPGPASGAVTFTVEGVISFIAAVVIGLFLHEVIHMGTALILGRKTLQDVKLGLDPKTLSPYFHCKVPLEVSVYRAVSSMPGILLGILPYILGLLFGNPWIMIFGLVFILGAGGDWLILWLLRGVRAGTLVEDHPSRVGCTVIEPDPTATE